MDQDSNTIKTPAITDKRILAISWNIATEPKLYYILAPNPYSQLATQIISERFSGLPISDIIKAVVLAEPEGRYDRNFRLLPKTHQEQVLSKQKYLTTNIYKRLDQYVKKHRKELHKLPKEFVYDCLSLVVFETTDVKKIEQKYAQNQRRDFRLAIIHYIENGDSLSATKISNVRKITSAMPLLLVGFAGFYLVLFFFLTQKQTQSIDTQPLPVKKQILGIETQKENQGLPIRLKIPSINVDAAIEHVGLTSNGAMEVPQNTYTVGWFNLGPRPGEKGSAVIAGHFNGKYGETGVFSNLNKLKEGDKLYIQDSKGTLITFVVRKIRAYSPGYADEVFSPNDKSHLNLITCDGLWDGIQKSYTKRLVVFADIMQ